MSIIDYNSGEIIRVDDFIERIPSDGVITSDFDGTITYGESGEPVSAFFIGLIDEIYSPNNEKGSSSSNFLETLFPSEIRQICINEISKFPDYTEVLDALFDIFSDIELILLKSSIESRSSTKLQLIRLVMEFNRLYRLLNKYFNKYSEISFVHYRDRIYAGLSPIELRAIIKRLIVETENTGESLDLNFSGSSVPGLRVNQEYFDSLPYLIQFQLLNNPGQFDPKIPAPHPVMLEIFKRLSDKGTVLHVVTANIRDIVAEILQSVEAYSGVTKWTNNDDVSLVTGTNLRLDAQGRFQPEIEGELIQGINKTIAAKNIQERLNRSWALVAGDSSVDTDMIVTAANSGTNVILRGRTLETTKKVFGDEIDKLPALAKSRVSIILD